MKLLQYCFVALLFTEAMIAKGEEFDLYFLGGQSNMEGFGTNKELPIEFTERIEGAWIFHSTPRADQQPLDGRGEWLPVTPGHGTGFQFEHSHSQLSDRFGIELSFAKTIRERRPNRKVALVKYARNGSSIHALAAGNFGCWEPDFSASSGLNSNINQYDQFLATIRNSQVPTDIDGDGTLDTFTPAGIVWMQGESDAGFTEEIANQYDSNLKRLIDLIRASLRSPDLPVAIGLISDSVKEAPNATWRFGNLVRDAQKRFVETDRRAWLVTETDEYQYSDPWHYDSRGYIRLGKRFAEGLLAVPLRRGQVIQPGAKLEIVAGEGVAGEGPAWHPTLGILTSGNGNINRWSRENAATIFRQDAGTNGLCFDRNGCLLACEQSYRRVSRMDTDGNWHLLTDSYRGHKYNSPNDVTYNSKGRIYFSDPRYGSTEDMEQLSDEGRKIEGVYRIDLDGTVQRIIETRVERPNGVLVSSGDRYLFVADNNNNHKDGARKLWRFEFDLDGNVQMDSARIIFEWGQGRGPDGLKEGHDGLLYVAGGLNKSNPPFEPDSTYAGGIYVMDVEGNLLDFIPVPTDEVTNCAFGDDDRRSLYITGGGVLYRIRIR